MRFREKRRGPKVRILLPEIAHPVVHRLCQRPGTGREVDIAVVCGGS